MCAINSLSPKFLRPNLYGVTVKVPELVAVPPGVVIAILPVFAPVGTVAVTCESELTAKVAALPPPNLTLDACVRPLPVITTGTPTLPPVGLKFRMSGTTVNTLLLVKVPAGVTTVTLPLVAPLGTVAVR